MVGFALYREAADVLGMPVWLEAVPAALRTLGGEADVRALYAEIGGKRPTRTQFWQEKIRQTLRRYSEHFIPVAPGRYRLQTAGFRRPPESGVTFFIF